MTQAVAQDSRHKRGNVLYMTVLALIFTVALTFATLELPKILATFLFELGWIPDINIFWEPEVMEAIMRTVRPIGYACLAIIAVLIAAGILTRNSKLTSLGAFFIFLPTFGYFAGTMFFLAGLGILRVAWLPFWDMGVVDFGDIAYLPYMLVTYLLALTGLDITAPIMRVPGPGFIVIDVRWLLAFFINAVGLFIFFLGTLAWVSGKYMREQTVTFWIYRYSRHPQYLGYIIWSYGVMLQSSLAPFSWGGENLGVSLPWVISSLVVLCIALKEEIDMIRRDERTYLSYKKSAPFMFWAPRSLVSLIKAPFVIVARKEYPENGKDIFKIFVIYFVILIVLSLPFLALNWVPGQMMGAWPYNMWPFITR